MKVTGTGPGSTERARDAGSAGAVGNKQEKRRSAPAEESSAGSDKVAISSKARDHAKAMEAARSAPEIDEAKVARFKAAVQNGSYKVDADKVADRMVEEHLASMY